MEYIVKVRKGSRTHETAGVYGSHEEAMKRVLELGYRAYIVIKGSVDEAESF